MSATGYPISVYLKGKLVVIVGGGKVAARKVAALIDSGADRIRVVAPEIDGSIPLSVERLFEHYNRARLDGASLVFTATDSAVVNEQVAIDARIIGVWVNRADQHDDGLSDFSSPAIHRRGDVTLTVTAGGNPAIATRIRDETAARIDPRLVTMAGLMRQLRPAIRSAIHLEPEQRRQLLIWLASDQALSVLDAGGTVAVAAEVRQRLERS